MRINLIYARARNGVIGRDNALPWHLPQDLVHFKRMTAGSPVVMGRKTWDSLPQRFRPLPGRANIVVTRQSNLQCEGATVVHDLAQAQSVCAAMPIPPQELWVIGGAEIYASALPLAQRIVVTELARDFDGDAFAPALDANWTETAREEQVAPDGMQFAFVTYLRQPRPVGPQSPTHSPMQSR